MHQTFCWNFKILHFFGIKSEIYHCAFFTIIIIRCIVIRFVAHFSISMFSVSTFFYFSCYFSVIPGLKNEPSRWVVGLLTSASLTTTNDWIILLNHINFLSEARTSARSLCANIRRKVVSANHIRAFRANQRAYLKHLFENLPKQNLWMHLLNYSNISDNIWTHESG